MVARSPRVPPKDAYAAVVVPWEVDEEIYGVSYRRASGIHESFHVGSQAEAAAVARVINAKAARRNFTDITA